MGKTPEKAFDLILTEDCGASGCEQWIPLLKQRKMDRPFFLWLASHDAHRTWQPDPDGKPLDPKIVPVPEPMLDTPETREDLTGYYNEIQRLDRYVGHVVDELTRQGVLDNTLILFISDNGRPFPRAKRWLIEDGSRTPWIVYWPAGLGTKAKTCDELVSAIDIAPTFLKLAGASVPEAIQGRSFLPQLSDPTAKICDYVFAERNWQVEYCHERMLRHDNWAYYRNNAPELGHFGFVNATFYKYPAYTDLWKYYRSGKPLTEMQKSVFLEPRPTEQLFNLETDPDELNDLAADPKYQEILARYHKAMDRWMSETGDTIPSKKRRTPDRHDRLTGERLYPTMHPGTKKFEAPGQSSGAEKIVLPGPR